jgi:hypothetical protein
MSLDIARTVHVDAEPDEVWRVLIDVERWPESTPSISGVRRLEQGELRIGSRAAIRQPRFPEVIWTVNRYVPGVEFVWESKSPGIRSTGFHSVAPGASGGADLALRIRQEGLFVLLFGWWLRGIDIRYLEMEARGMKQRAEASHAAAVLAAP